MVKENSGLAHGSIKFFGKMSASATHEIKNTLSIINESVGLLQDLSVTVGPAQPISLEKIDDIASKVTKQVLRTDLILTKLNRFSHSADLSSQILDLEQTVNFVLDMGSRIIQMQGVKIEVASPPSSVKISSNLFFMENLIWNCIENAMNIAKGNKTIKISFGTDSTAPSVWFSMDGIKEELMDDLLGSKDEKALLQYLDITVEKNKKNNSFGLLWAEPI